MSADKIEAIKITSRKDYTAEEHGPTWWYTGAWKESGKEGAGYQEPQIEFSANFRVQNPDCKHDHCAITQLECDRCLEYSKMYRAEWIANRGKEIKK